MPHARTPVCTTVSVSFPPATLIPAMESLSLRLALPVPVEIRPGGRLGVDQRVRLASLLLDALAWWWQKQCAQVASHGTSSFRTFTPFSPPNYYFAADRACSTIAMGYNHMNKWTKYRTQHAP
jgi:hypothetical protein